MAWGDLLAALKKKKVRKGWRRPVRFPVVVVDGNDRHHPGELVEVGAHGFRIRTARSIARGTGSILRFMVKVEGGDDSHGVAFTGKTLDIPIDVIWTRKEGVGSFSFAAGGRYDHLTRDQRKTLFALVLGGPGVDLSDEEEHRGHGRLVYEGSLGHREMAIRDISETGAGLLTRQAYPVGVRIEIALDDEDGTFGCAGRVVRCQELLKGSVFHVGLAFDKMDKKVKERLAGFLAAIAAREAERHPASQE